MMLILRVVMTMVMNENMIKIFQGVSPVGGYARGGESKKTTRAV